MADEHICNKSERITALEVSTNQQGKDIDEIKKDLKDLTSKVEKNHEEMNSELKLIRSDVADIKTSIAAQSIKIDALTETVGKSVEHIDTLNTKVDDIDKTVIVHTQKIKDLTATTSDHDQRLVKVEKKVWKIVAIIAGAIFVLQLISTMSSCSDIKHFVKQMFIEEQTGQAIE